MNKIMKAAATQNTGPMKDKEEDRSGTAGMFTFLESMPDGQSLL